MPFCADLHGVHSSHSLQMLRNDRKRRAYDIDNSSVEVDEVTDLPGEVPLDQSSPHAFNSDGDENCYFEANLVGEDATVIGDNDEAEPSSMVDNGKIAEISQNNPNNLDFAESVHSSQMTLQRLLNKRDATAAGLQSTSHSFPAEMVDGTELMEPVAPNPSSSKLRTSQIDCPQPGFSWRSAYDDPNKRKAHEDKKVKDAVAFIRRHLESGTATAEILFAKFNSPSCYDIEFIKLLAKEFKTDISDVLARRGRAQYKEVLKEFIFKLLL